MYFHLVHLCSVFRLLYDIENSPNSENAMYPTRPPSHIGSRMKLRKAPPFCDM